MGQKVNPNIFRLGKTKFWETQHFEKKKLEKPLYTFKDLEIKNFIIKFFNDYNLNVHNLNIKHHEDFLIIKILYFINPNSLSYINSVNKNQNIRFNPKTKFYKQKKSYFKKYSKFVLNNKKFNSYSYLQKTKNLLKNRTLKRINFLKYYKNNKTINQFKSVYSIKQNDFIKKLLDSLKLFCNKNTKIYLKLNQLNNNLKCTINPQKLKFIKRYLVKLRKYKQNHFFKEGINIVFTSLSQSKSSNLLSNFIANQLQKNKKHNFFLKFLKTTLILLNSNTFSKIKGLKIKIKGRFNGTPRAKHKIIRINNGTSLITLTSKIDYSETTAFTSNGTFGVKVWIHQN